VIQLINFAAFLAILVGWADLSTHRWTLVATGQILVASLEKLNMKNGKINGERLQTLNVTFAISHLVAWKSQAWSTAYKGTSSLMFTLPVTSMSARCTLKK
jgi:hypothetical protein